MPNLSGKWALANHDSLDAVLDKLQVPAEKRPPATITDFSMEIVQDGDNFTVKNVAKRGTRETTFTVGTSFETELLMGTMIVKVSSKWDGECLVLTGEKGAKLSRCIVGNQLVSTIDVGGTCAKFYFNKA